MKQLALFDDSRWVTEQDVPAEAKCDCASASASASVKHHPRSCDGVAVQGEPQIVEVHLHVDSFLSHAASK